MIRRNPGNGRSSSKQTLPGFIVVCLLLVLLLLFSRKPFHVDDTFFVEAAKDVLLDPSSPYRSRMNWDGELEWLWSISFHPPLHCYLLAGASFVVGSGEFALHVVWALLAAACSYLMFLLARRFCEHPALATLLAVLNPGFFVSATTLMADISLLFFWLLAVQAVVSATERNRRRMLCLSAVAASAAAMTKYFGVAVVPLSVVWCLVLSRTTNTGGDGVCRWRLAWGSVGVLCTPIAVLIAWGVYSMLQPECGFFHPLAAAKFSTSEKSLAVLLQGARGALSFLGGALVWPLFILPVCGNLSRWLKVCLAGLAVFVIVCGWFSIAIPGVGQSGASLLETSDFMALAGAAAVTFAAASCSARRDAASLLLGLWCFGTIVFCATINWTINVRVLLPAVFPISVLVIRWVESLRMGERWLLWIKVSLCPTLAISLLVAIADYDFAVAGKHFAQTTIRDFVSQGERVSFAGHWGFQYYMEREGATPLDYVTETAATQNGYYLLKPGGVIVYPDNNSGLEPKMRNVTLLKRSEVPARFGVHTMSKPANAGFYSSVHGNAPYNVDWDHPVDAFSVYRVIDAPGVAADLSASRSSREAEDTAKPP